jgi:type I restriction enzyme M protein
VEAIIILPRELFITTDISVTLWILNQNKKGGSYHGRQLRSREHEILFMDLRTWTENPVKNESKKKVMLSTEQIERAASIYHTWQQEGTNGAAYAVPELYRSVGMDEIAAGFDGQGYGKFKDAVADCVIAALEPIQSEYDRISADKAYLQQVMDSGRERASAIAHRTMLKVRKKLGIAPWKL